MVMSRLGLATRPPLGRYLIVLAAAALGWTAYVMFGYYQLYETTGVNAPGIMMTIRNGLLGLLAVVVLVFGLHWIWRLGAPGTAKPDAATAEQMPAAEHAHGGNPAIAQQLAQQGQRYVLEVRSLGLMVNRYGPDDIRERLFVPDNDPHVPILSQDPKDYPAIDSQRLDAFGRRFGGAFGDAAAYGVERWPIPAFALGPPKDKLSQFRPALEIADGRQKATLGVTLLLWQDDANTLDAQPMIDQLFAFFDEHPDVPEALIFSEDGDVMRDLLGKPGGGSDLPDGAYVPHIPDSMVALLVSRSDRVDHLVRPYAVSGVSEGINLHDTQYDVIKLWNFFWERRDAYDNLYEEEHKTPEDRHPQTPGVPKADWWITQLPTLWKTTTNQGPGNFKPSPYLPVRWTDWQVNQFDSAPRIGYLHRPVHVKLTDEHGKPLPSAEQVKALQEGWQQALGTLGEGDKPARVFYDTSGDRRWITPLTLALHGNSEGIDLEDAKQGYDIGRRIADTGVSSPLVQIGLALVAGYDDGESSATINRRPNGDASILMVSPPDPQSKAANPRKDPFAYRGR